MFSASAGARVAVHAHRRELVHPGAVVADVAVDLDLDLRVEPAGDRVRAVRVDDAPPPRPGGRRRGRAGAGSARAAGVTARSTTSTAVASAASAAIRPSPAPRRRRRPGAGSHARASAAPGSTAIARHSERHRDPVVGLREHGRLAGDRVAQHGEAVDRADEEGVEAVEVVEAALERLLERGALAQPPGEVAGRDLGVVLGLEARCPRGAAARAAGCGSTASRCGRGTGRARSRTDASPRSSRGSRSPCACGRARGVAAKSASANCSANCSGPARPPCRSRSTCPALITRSSGSALAHPAPRPRRPPRPRRSTA